MSGVTVALPLSDDAAKACVVAADLFGVEPWEVAVHALSDVQRWALADTLIARRETSRG